MNKVILIGRLTSDPKITFSQNNELAIAKYILAVDRGRSKGKEQETDFIRCVAFGKTAEFAGNYLNKGMKIAVCGSIQAGSYKKEDGTSAYYVTVNVREHEFCEPKKNNCPEDEEIIF